MNGDVRANLWPVYVVADQSGSMAEHMDEVNAGLGSLRRTMLAEPLSAAKIRFTMVGFSGDATVLAHLLDLREADEFEPLDSHGGTNYEAVFNLLRELIPKDVATLKSQQYAVYRPTVFFLSDGQPNDPLGWLEAHRSLTDREVTRAAPNIIACGIGDVRAETIRQLATRQQYAFIVNRGVDIGKAVSEFFTALTKSIVASTRTFGGGQDRLVVEPPAGFSVVLDEV